MDNPISNDVFDSRDLIEYKEFLENEILDFYIDFAENHNEYKDEEAEPLEIPTVFDEIEFIDEEVFTMTCEDILEEYKEILDFYDELSGSADFIHGETIIHGDYFTEYCKDFLEGCGYIPKDLPSRIEIDFESTAKNLSQDYYVASYKDADYYIRY